MKKTVDTSMIDEKIVGKKSLHFKRLFFITMTKEKIYERNPTQSSFI